MPRPLTQYRVFIGSPGGLEKERRAFRDVIASFNRDIAEVEGVSFCAVGWEEALGGQGRPQALINDDLSSCDYAVFSLHDRWGTPTGSGATSGTEEEWLLAQSLYEEKRIRKLFLTFKSINKSHLKDPGDQLKKVLTFKNAVSGAKTHLYKDYTTVGEFSDILRGHLFNWLRDHKMSDTSSRGDTQGLTLSSSPETGPAGEAIPGFSFWRSEARKYANDSRPDVGLYCSEMAVNSAKTSTEVVDSKQLLALSKFHMNEQREALDILSAIYSEHSENSDSDIQRGLATSIYNAAVMLNAMGRRQESIQQYRLLVSRYRDANEPEIRERLAMGMVNLADALDDNGSQDEAIEVTSEFVSLFGQDDSGPILIQRAKAAGNLGVIYTTLSDIERAIECFDDVIQSYRYTALDDIAASVSLAYLNKSIALAEQGDRRTALTTLTTMIEEFTSNEAVSVQENVARAMINAAVSYGELDEQDEEIALYGKILEKYGSGESAVFRLQVARALFNRRIAYNAVGNSDLAENDEREFRKRYTDDHDPKIGRMLSRLDGETSTQAA